ncbi:MAG: amino acid racemase [Chloroflexota bacterium]|nr:MAG: amino acid racemase [Chloroflexota bacterium]
MKTLGIIGGIGPESTIEYYRQLIAAYQKRNLDGSYPAIFINSIDMTKMLGFAGANELARLCDYLLAEVQKLADAGAETGLLASNTPHVVFDDLSRVSPIPLISIVETACQTVQEAGLNKVGLFGTRFTMGGRFYSDVFSRVGITLISPQSEEQGFIHNRYMGELVRGVILPETRRQMLEIVDRLIDEEHIQGLILGGTELPLILRDEAYRGIPFFDTTRIHVEAVAEQIF